MNATKFAIISFLIMPVTAVAIPSFSGLKGSDCNSSSYDRGFSELVQKVTIIGKEDGRKAMKELAEGDNPKITKAELSQIRKSTGYVYCPGTKYNNQSTCSGALVGTDQTIVTAAHCFIDERGRRREPLEGCFFQNLEKKWQKVELDFSPGSYKFYSATPYQDSSNDRAIVRIKRKIKGAKPFPVSDRRMLPGTEMILSSVGQENMVRKVDSTEPVGQVCTTMHMFPPDNISGTVYYTDCDAGSGGSGGLALVRRNGKLEAVGTLVGGSDDDQNYTEYTPNVAYTRIVGYDPIHLVDIKAVANGEAKIAASDSARVPN